MLSEEFLRPFSGRTVHRSSDRLSALASGLPPSPCPGSDQSVQPLLHLSGPPRGYWAWALLDPRWMIASSLRGFEAEKLKVLPIPRVHRISLLIRAPLGNWDLSWDRNLEC
ncbi:hypothetical protein RRG08_013455 [Elysia crispata]|uniref:Uncharacterized protein n=1 Tax=Elysia crispata TaxID=231223 RepID=A0AAE1EBY3_9GAST|nr:hypothetical protein RRG08_013455 [Elysia crispata]